MSATATYDQQADTLQITASEFDSAAFRLSGGGAIATSDDRAECHARGHIELRRTNAVATAANLFRHADSVGWTTVAAIFVPRTAGVTSNRDGWRQGGHGADRFGVKRGQTSTASSPG